MNCMICGKKTYLCEHLKNVPIRGGSFEKERREILTGYDIDYFHCPQCGHGQIPYFMPEHWYENYKIVDTNDEKELRSYYNISFKNFFREKIARLREIACDNNYVVDIGSGIGVTLELLLEKFRDGIGVEPSAVQIQLVKNEIKSKVWKGYYEQMPVEHKFSAFFCTDLLEHLERPDILLRKAYEDLAMAGVGYIAVPNGSKIYYENRWQDVLVEHISYFSPYSLMYLLQKTGFYVCSLGETRGGWWLEAYVEKKTHESSFNEKRQEQNCLLKETTKKYEVIGIWGAGIKGSMLLRQLDVNIQKRISYVFDKDKGKENKYIQGTDIKIAFPCEEFINECDVIMITSLEYVDEITHELRENYKYQNAVCIIK